MVDASDTRQANRALVLGRLVVGGAVTRAQLAREVGLSKATVSRVVDDLIELGIAQEGASLSTARRGPKPTAVGFCGEGRIICGVDLGATNVRFVVSDLAGHLLQADRLQTPTRVDSGGLAVWLKDQMLTAGGHEERRLQATAIGVPGVVHPVTDGIRHADNLPAINGSAAFSAQLMKVLPGKLVLGNDANLAVTGEAAFGAARGCSCAVMFTLGTGIGTGVLMGGQPLTGRTGLVGEFAYLRVPLVEGTAVALEDLLGGSALLRRAAELGHPLTTPREIFDAAGPTSLKGLRQQALEALHDLFTAVTLAYEPEIIVVGGGLRPSLDRWLPDLQARLTAGVPEAPPIVPSELGDFAGALGALALAWQQALAGFGLNRPALETGSAAQLGRIPKSLPLCDLPENG
jgi:predicted NBD/HSP70 family sugar kinase